MAAEPVSLRRAGIAGLPSVVAPFEIADTFDYFAALITYLAKQCVEVQVIIDWGPTSADLARASTARRTPDVDGGPWAGADLDRRLLRFAT